MYVGSKSDTDKRMMHWKVWKAVIMTLF